MGKRITQNIYICSLCDEIPNDGDYLWEMGVEFWCEKCCNKIEKQ